MNSEDLKKQAQSYVIAIIKSSALTLAKNLKDIVIKVDPMTSIKYILAKLKKQLEISENDSIFLYAYGNILSSEDTIGNVLSRFKGKVKGTNKLELFYS